VKAYPWRNAHYPEDHLCQLASQHALAGAYRTVGQVSKVEELLEHVLAVEVKVLVEDRSDRIVSQRALMSIYKLRATSLDAFR